MKGLVSELFGYNKRNRKFHTSINNYSIRMQVVWFTQLTGGDLSNFNRTKVQSNIGIFSIPCWELMNFCLKLIIDE